MNVSFLNVGQGDSIVLNWLYKGVHKYALIDCKAQNGSNPTIDYLKKNKVEQVEFLILSHPHSDHFSGILELLDFLQINNIRLRYFFFTSAVSPIRIKAAVQGFDEELELANLYTEIYRFKELMDFKFMALNETPNSMALNEDWKWMTFSPSISELDKFSAGANYNMIDNDEEVGNEARGNLLSTLLVFYTDQSYFLLTADCEINTFKRIDNDADYRKFFLEKKLILAQIPHHGSEKNYRPTFWKTKKVKKYFVPAVISVGKNKYGHPSKSVLESLSVLGYSVFTTEPLSNFSVLTQASGIFLNVISTLHLSTNQGVKFDFTENEAKELKFD